MFIFNQTVIFMVYSSIMSGLMLFKFFTLNLSRLYGMLIFVNKFQGRKGADASLDDSVACFL